MFPESEIHIKRTAEGCNTNKNIELHIGWAPKKARGSSRPTPSKQILNVESADLNIDDCGFSRAS